MGRLGACDGVPCCFIASTSASAHKACSLADRAFLAALQLKELKQELGALRVAKVTGGAPNKLSKM